MPFVSSVFDITLIDATIGHAQQIKIIFKRLKCTRDGSVKNNGHTIIHAQLIHSPLTFEPFKVKGSHGPNPAKIVVPRAIQRPCLSHKQAKSTKMGNPSLLNSLFQVPPAIHKIELMGHRNQINSFIFLSASSTPGESKVVSRKEPCKKAR